MIYRFGDGGRKGGDCFTPGRTPGFAMTLNKRGLGLKIEWESKAPPEGWRPDRKNPLQYLPHRVRDRLEVNWGLTPRWNTSRIPCGINPASSAGHARDRPRE
jgi:hypothetical protein